jgi:hypothetical protein
MFAAANTAHYRGNGTETKRTMADSNGLLITRRTVISLLNICSSVFNYRF